MKRILQHAAIPLVFGVIMGCASAPNPEVKQVGPSEFERAANKYDVDTDRYDAFALHTEDGCAIVYIDKQSFEAYNRSPKLVARRACAGNTVTN